MGKLEKKIRQNLIGKTGSHLKIILYVNWELLCIGMSNSSIFNVPTRKSLFSSLW